MMLIHRVKALEQQLADLAGLVLKTDRAERAWAVFLRLIPDPNWSCESSVGTAFMAVDAFDKVAAQQPEEGDEGD